MRPRQPRCLYLFSALLSLGLLLPLASAQSALDSDHDGLSDEQEQMLLEKFRPEFLISSNDCAIKPARFKEGESVPQVVAQDGTIYGQVTPVPNSNRIEIHYYTLWDKDCGRNGHPLDAEHVSALLTNEAGADARALYWYAGAHEDTACNISSGARGPALAAEEKGPRVWSSSGKHALYFRKAMCGHGCGADVCDNSVKLATSGPVVNLGEPKAPMNGTLWSQATEWALPTKMNSTNFPADIIAKLDATSGEEVITVSGRSTFRGTIAVSGTVLDAGKTGAGHTGSALDTAQDHTSKSMGTATKATGNALTRAWHAVFGGGEKKQKAPDPTNTAPAKATP